MLVALGGSSVSVDQLTESLWPESDGDRAYGVFTITLRRLRELIGQEALILRNGRLSLDPEVCWVDVVQFSYHATAFSRASQNGNAPSAEQHFQRAVEVYKGPFLPGEFAPGETLSARAQLHAVLLRMVLAHGDHHQNAGNVEQAVAVFERGLEADDTAEILYQRLMRCYVAQSRFNDCIALYQRCRDLLEAKAGVTPSADTQAIIQEATRALKDSKQPDASRHLLGTAEIIPGASEARDLNHRATSSANINKHSEKRVATLASFRFHLPAVDEDMDPESFQRALGTSYSRASAIVADHGGELAPLAGNTAIAAFGSKSSSENDAERAVRAAIAVRDLSRNNPVSLPNGAAIAVSIGIATGPFAANAPEHGDRLQPAIIGVAANRAVGLAAEAQGHQVLSDQQTWHAVRSYFSGNATTPNSEVASAKAFEIQGSVVTGSRFDAAIHRGLSPFLAREWELETLQLCYDLVQRGQGQLVSIVGDPGIGKSRLIHEFSQSIANDGVLILEGSCQSFGLGLPYRPIQEILRTALGLDGTHSTTEVDSEVCERIVGVSPHLERYLPHLLYLASVPSEQHNLPGSLQGNLRRHELQDAVTEFVHQLAAQRPVVLICEDWHWVDESSEAALYSLVSQFSRIPLLVIVAHRPEYHPIWTRFENHRSIALRPLDSAQSTRLLHSILRDTPISEALAETIYTRSQGNALFIEEVAQSLATDELGLATTPGVSLKDTTAFAAVPQSIQAVIRTRIDHLDAEDRHLLRVCSAIGQTFSLDVLEKVAPHGIEQITERIEQLAQMDLVRPLRLLASNEFQFKHIVTHEVVYDSLLLSQRRMLHTKIGEAIEGLYSDRPEEYCELLAHHFFNSDETGKAAKYLELSGDKAVRQTALEVARQDYERALALLGAGLENADRTIRAIDVTHKLASVSEYAPSIRLVEALNTARESAVGLSDDRRLAYTTYWMGRVRYIRGNLSEALSYFETAAKISERIGDPSLRARCLSALGRTCVYTAEHERGIGYLLKSLDILEAMGSQEEYSYSSHVLGLHYGMLGDFEKAFDFGTNGLRIAVEGRMVSRQPMAQNQLAWLHGVRGDFSLGLQVISGAREQTRKVGDVYSTGIGSIVEGWLRFMSSDHVAGIRLMSKGIEVVKSAGSNMALTQWHSVLAEVL
ncbi:MAG TPA: AAA family ATPase, partial [Terriglobales bacterium]